MRGTDLWPTVPVLAEWWIANSHSAVRRDHANPVKLEGVDGLVLSVNWAHVRLIAPRPEPAI